MSVEYVYSVLCVFSSSSCSSLCLSALLHPPLVFNLLDSPNTNTHRYLWSHSLLWSNHYLSTVSFIRSILIPLPPLPVTHMWTHLPPCIPFSVSPNGDSLVPGVIYNLFNKHFKAAQIFALCSACGSGVPNVTMIISS